MTNSISCSRAYFGDSSSSLPPLSCVWLRRLREAPKLGVADHHNYFPPLRRRRCAPRSTIEPIAGHHRAVARPCLFRFGLVWLPSSRELMQKKKLFVYDSPKCLMEQTLRGPWSRGSSQRYALHQRKILRRTALLSQGPSGTMGQKLRVYGTLHTYNLDSTIPSEGQNGACGLQRAGGCGSTLVSTGYTKVLRYYPSNKLDSLINTTLTVPSARPANLLR